MVLTRESQHMSGPLPSPAILAEYEKNHPGFAERIMVMAEKEQSHRHEKESLMLQSDTNVNKEIMVERQRGQHYAFAIAVIAITAGTYASVNGNNIAGSVIGGGGVVGLVSAFLYSRKMDSIRKTIFQAPERKQSGTV